MSPDDVDVPVAGTRQQRLFDRDRIDTLETLVVSLRRDLDDALDLVAELDVKVRRLVVAERRRS